MAEGHARRGFAIVDVDDVLIATGGALDAACEAMLIPLAEHLGRRRAAAVQREFKRFMDIGVRRLRSAEDAPDAEYAALMRRTAWWQRGLIDDGFDVKTWSRHALVACALQTCDLPVTAAIVDAAAGAYWSTVASSAHVYPDAAPFVGRLRDAGVAVHLATGSDGFLAFDDARQTFTYDPRESVRLKLDRLRCLPELGFSDGDVTTGDPVGKPEPAFCKLVLERFACAAGEEVALARTVVVGDSLTNDILPFLRLGAARGVWLLRDGADGVPACPPGVVIADRLGDEAVLHAISG